ncbi:MAG: spermidine/putrescine ABC transporter substrate-binding protein [Lentisphaerae bacterium]|nr:spermidine/putrescine ABC transporter substrate-binding protein [Lentisphaerota bacterium]
MKKLHLRMLTTVLAGVLMLGCAKKPLTLHVFIWSDYIKPEIVQSFEQKFGCKIVLDYYDSNESMYAKLKAGGGGYDLVFPSSYMVNIMQRQDMLQPLDHAKIPNIQHLDPAANRFTMDSNHVFSVPYMLGSSGIGYLTSKVPDFKPTWRMFGDPAYKGRMTLMNDYREAIGAALKALGYSLNTLDTNELVQARDLLIQWKANIAKFESEQYKNGLISAEFLLVHGYSGDIMQIMEENADIAYVVPEEGTSVALDEIVLLKQAPQPELAHAFINFLHEPEIAAQNIEFVYYLCPNLAAYELVSDEVRNDPAVFLPQNIMDKSEVVWDLGENNALYSHIWDEVKGAE